MKDKRFDDIIRLKIDELGDHLSVQPDWHAFQEKYSEAVNLNQNSFDQVIKSKLAGLESTTLGHSDWDTFKELFKDELGVNDVAFDSQVQTSLQNYQVDYNASHWPLMKEALEKEEFIRTSIYFSKLVEAGCIFLILFTFLNIFNINGSVTIDQNSIDSQPIATEPNKEQKTPHSAYTKMQQGIASNNNKPVESYNKEGLQHNINSERSLAMSNVESARKATLNKIVELKQLSNRTALDVPFLQSNYNNHFSPVARKTQEISLPNNPIASEHKSGGRPVTESEDDWNIDEEMILAEMSDIVSLQPQELELKRSFYIPILPSWHSRAAKTERFVSLSAAPTVNIINTPFDHLLKTAPYTTDALGGELGINYSIRRNNLEVETGLIYALKSYTPRKVDEVVGSFFTSFKRLRLNQITHNVLVVPLNLKYHFTNNDNWGMYAIAGTSLNSIISSDFLVLENGKKISIDDVQTTYRSSGTAQKNFSKGIIEGGSLMENLYFTFDFGIGIERKLNQNTHFFMAPTFRKYIGLAGIGPNNVKVNSLGLNMGIKKRI